MVDMKSFIITAVLLNVEVFDLIIFLIGCNNIKELSQAVLLEILFSEVFEVSFGERNTGINCDLSVLTDGHFYFISQLAQFPVNFYSLAKEFSKVRGVEHLILHRLGAVNPEVQVHFLFFSGLIMLHCGN